MGNKLIASNSQVEVWITEQNIHEYYTDILRDIIDTFKDYFKDIDSDDYNAYVLKAHEIFLRIIGKDIYEALGEVYNLSTESIKKKINIHEKRITAWISYKLWVEKNFKFNEKTGFYSGGSEYLKKGDVKVWTPEQAKLICQSQFILEAKYPRKTKDKAKRNSVFHMFDARTSEKFYKETGLRTIEPKTEEELLKIHKHIIDKANRNDSLNPHDYTAVAKWDYIITPIKPKK